MLTTTPFYWDPPTAVTIGTWDTTSADWSNDGFGSSSRVNWQNSNSTTGNLSVAEFQSGSALTMNLSGNISPSEAEFFSAGPYTITGGTLSLQSALIVDTAANVTAEIDSPIAGSCLSVASTG